MYIPVFIFRYTYIHSIWALQFTNDNHLWYRNKIYLNLLLRTNITSGMPKIQKYFIRYLVGSEREVVKISLWPAQKYNDTRCIHNFSIDWIKSLKVQVFTFSMHCIASNWLNDSGHNWKVTFSDEFKWIHSLPFNVLYLLVFQCLLYCVEFWLRYVSGCSFWFRILSISHSFPAFHFFCLSSLSPTVWQFLLLLLFIFNWLIRILW